MQDVALGLPWLTPTLNSAAVVVLALLGRSKIDGTGVIWVHSGGSEDRLIIADIAIRLVAGRCMSLWPTLGVGGIRHQSPRAPDPWRPAGKRGVLFMISCFDRPGAPESRQKIRSTHLGYLGAALGTWLG